MSTAVLLVRTGWRLWSNGLSRTTTGYPDSIIDRERTSAHLATRGSCRTPSTSCEGM